jgi:hypothetical protein
VPDSGGWSGGKSGFRRWHRQASRQPKKKAGNQATTEESKMMCTSKQDWRLGCYDSEGKPGICVIDSDHDALRVGLTGGERTQFFELRGEQVGKFRVALDEAIMAANGLGAQGEDCQLGNPPSSYAMGTSGGDEARRDPSLLTLKINMMVAAASPYTFALVEEIDDGADAVIFAWGMDFSDFAVVVNDGGVLGVFGSAQRAQQLFSVCNPIRLVWLHSIGPLANQFVESPSAVSSLNRTASMLTRIQEQAMTKSGEQNFS